MFKKDLVFVLDFDGILTNGKMYYTKDGKTMKCIGCDDWDLLKELSTIIAVNVISADWRGFPITLKRVEEEMKLELDLVKGNGVERWNWIKKKYPVQEIIFMGDSFSDWYSLKNADLGITVIDALDYVKNCSDVVINRRGGDRAVAEAVLYISEKYDLFEPIQ